MLRWVVCGILSCLAFAHAAQAAVVRFDQVQAYTVEGQTLTYDFTRVGPAVGNIAAVLIKTGGFAKGFPGIDVGTATNEYFDLTFEGVAVGRFGCGSHPGIITIPVNNGSITDCIFELGVTTADIAMDYNAAVADGVFRVALDFSPFVGAADDRDEIIVSLAYLTSVPLPASGALLGALALDAVAVRRKTAQA